MNRSIIRKCYLEETKADLLDSPSHEVSLISDLLFSSVVIGTVKEYDDVVEFPRNISKLLTLRYSSNTIKDFVSV